MVIETERYIRIMERQLAARPLCQYCAARGIVSRATTCDHRDGLVSLCEECDTIIARWGYLIDIGLDGWPLDKNHPIYAQRAMVSAKK
jgi:hypothetical protein